MIEARLGGLSWTRGTRNWGITAGHRGLVKAHRGVTKVQYQFKILFWIHVLFCKTFFRPILYFKVLVTLWQNIWSMVLVQRVARGCFYLIWGCLFITFFLKIRWNFLKSGSIIWWNLKKNWEESLHLLKIEYEYFVVLVLLWDSCCGVQSPEKGGHPNWPTRTGNEISSEPTILRLPSIFNITTILLIEILKGQYHEIIFAWKWYGSIGLG
jgi:hypothetical protein